MKKNFILIISIIFYCYSLFAQSIEWQKSYGGSNFDYAKCIRQTHDGGYIIAGTSASNNGDVSGNLGGDDFWIVKIDSLSGIEWGKTFGGSTSDHARSVEETNDGGYIITGSTLSVNGDVTGNHGGSDYWVIKLDTSGSIQWKKAYGGSNNDEAYCIKQTNDNGFIVSGTSNSNNGDVSGNHGNSDYWIVKLDSVGSIQWQKSLGGDTVDGACSAQQTLDGGYIVAGYSYSNDGNVMGNHGTSDYWIVKLDSWGNIQWQKSLGGSVYDYAASIRQTNDKGYIVAGSTCSIDGDVTGLHGQYEYDYWIVKLDSTGVLQWQKALGGTSIDQASDVVQTNDGGYITVGIAQSFDGDVTGNHFAGDFWIVKLNSLGNIQWQKALGGNGTEDAYSVQQTVDGDFIIAGGSSSGYSGDVTYNHGFEDYWVVKLSANVGISDYAAKNEIVIYPNPSYDRINIQIPQCFGSPKGLEIFNCIGQLQLERTDNFTDIDINSLASGLYFIVLTNLDNERLTSKILKE